MPLSGIRDFIARHAIRDVTVYRIDDFNVEPPEVVKTKTRVPTKRLYPQIKISVGNPFDLDKKIPCSAKRYKLLTEQVKSRNQKIKRYVKQDIKTHKITLGKKIKTSSPLKQVQAMPQERGNTLKILKKKPTVANNEMILACYGPIVEGAVEKLVLNKQRGTLLIWYNPGSRHNKAKNVYLIRRLGMGSKPEWRWL
ncbi:MAG: hypothetical protein IJS40_08315 [Synergistaceae bacterium]|nr:hypothetical protein [Synergistaceae bacterium]